MSRIWRYVIANDDDVAPHVDKDGQLLTLCLCKPLIRKYADVDDWVLAFKGASLSKAKGNLCWVGRITEKLAIGDYQKKYPHRRDAIYAYINTNGEGKLKKIKGHDIHPDAASIKTDLSGVNCLLFTEFMKFDDDIRLPENLENLVYAYRGQKYRTDANTDYLSHLVTWFKKTSNTDGVKMRYPESNLCDCPPKKVSKVRKSCG